MRQLVFRSAGLAGILAASAAGQCRLDPWNFGVGAIDNERAVVSSRAGQGVPVVHFFDKSALGWQTGTAFVLGDLQIFYQSPVAIDGDRALAGAPECDWQKGRAFVFDRFGTQWFATELISPTVQYADFFGSVAALDGEVAVVGADHWAMGNGDGLGRVHVFEHQGSTWTEVTQLMIHPTALDIEGSTIAVGSTKFHPGRVEIHDRIGGSWVLTQTIPGGSSTYGPALGSSVALQGDTLAVGAAYAYGRPGYVQVFRRQSGVWHLLQHIVSGEPAAGDRFGECLALSGSTLLVGAPITTGPGLVHRFEHDGTSYVLAGSFGPEPGDVAFGWTVDLEGEDAFLGCFPNSHFYRLGFADASAYCPATPNSTGARGVLAPEGCDSRSGELLTLVSNRLPPAAIGVVFFGLNTAQQPLGDGTLCIGPPLRRLPVAVADHSGRMVHEVDFESWPGSSLAAGRTWKFQTVFRDPATPGARLNLTNALAIPMTP